MVKQGSSCPGGLHQAPPGPGTAQDQTPLGPDPPDQAPPVDRMTDKCKHITLPQTSFAGGKKPLCAYALEWIIIMGFMTFKWPCHGLLTRKVWIFNDFINESWHTGSSWSQLQYFTYS